jgi:hypothetical protein
MGRLPGACKPGDWPVVNLAVASPLAVRKTRACPRRDRCGGGFFLFSGWDHHRGGPCFIGVSSSWVPAFQADFRKEEGVTDLTRFRRKINLPVVVSQADLSA